MLNQESKRELEYRLHQLQKTVRAIESELRRREQIREQELAHLSVESVLVECPICNGEGSYSDWSRDYYVQESCNTCGTLGRIPAPLWAEGRESYNHDVFEAWENLLT